jgi:hypothetical protein
MHLCAAVELVSHTVQRAQVQKSITSYSPVASLKALRLFGGDPSRFSAGQQMPRFPDFVDAGVHAIIDYLRFMCASGRTLRLAATRDS